MLGRVGRFISATTIYSRGEKKIMRRKLHFPNQHPLKKEIRERQIRLWQLRDHTGASEPKLSRYLNGIDPMPEDLERRIKELLKGFYHDP